MVTPLREHQADPPSTRPTASPHTGLGRQPRFAFPEYGPKARITRIKQIEMCSKLQQHKIIKQ